MKILAIGAHLDDIEIACGGTLAKAIQNGHHVKAIIMSESGYKDSEGQQKRTNETAINEGKKALKTLGIEDITILDFPAKDIFFHSSVVDALDKIIDEYNPDIIFTHHPFDTHQAHEGVSKSTIAAARRKNTIYFYDPIYPAGRSYVAFKPQMYVNITDTLKLKLDALREHKSEYTKFGGESWVSGIQCRAGYRGLEINVPYAEAFEVLREELSFDKTFNI